jgi:hypothetical protein
MTDAKLKGIRRLTGSALAFGAVCAAAAINPGCGPGTETTTTTTTSTGTQMATSSSGMETTSSSSSGTGGGSCNSGPFQGNLAPGANGGFSDAFDAVPNADGSAVFFTGIDSTGNPGVFTQDICTAGATVKPVYTGGAFEAPFGIALSTDGMTLYVGDISAAEIETGATSAKNKGIIFSLKSAGGSAPSILEGSVTPRGLTVVSEGGADQIYFTGIDKNNGKPGVFKIAAAGGAVSTIAEGLPFVDPAGVAVSAAGDVYVLDYSASGATATSLGSSRGTIILVPKGGAAGEFAPAMELQLGYPAGLALMQDDSKLLVSGLSPTASSDVLIEVTVATKAVVNNNMGIDTYGEAAGLHRAHKANVFAWADTKAKPMGMTGTGTVFVIK